MVTFKLLSHLIVQRRVCHLHMIILKASNIIYYVASLDPFIYLFGEAAMPWDNLIRVFLRFVIIFYKLYYKICKCILQKILNVNST